MSALMPADFFNHARKTNSNVSGAPEGIRTPDPQIRSLVLYPAELPAPSGASLTSICDQRQLLLATRKAEAGTSDAPLARRPACGPRNLILAWARVFR